jgi:Arc/MetJ family transcription regulator
MSMCYAKDMRKTRTTVHLEDKDKEAIAAIKEHYGLSSNDDAIRLALRELLRTLKKKEGGIPPHA